MSEWSDDAWTCTYCWFGDCELAGPCRADKCSCSCRDDTDD